MDMLPLVLCQIQSLLLIYCLECKILSSEMLEDD